MRALALAVGMWGAAAFACPVCGAPTDQSVYLAMTIVMSLLPLAAMGTVVGVIVVRARRQARLPPS